MLKRFLLRAVFFCVICLCYAQQEGHILPKEAETLETATANQEDKALQENREPAEQEHADVPEVQNNAP